MPRVGLTRDRVVEEAATLADEVGFDHLTLSALAERVGVRQPSLYKHLDSLAALRRSIAIQSARELGEVMARASVGRSGADAISALAHAYRDWALCHPGRYAASHLPPAPGDVLHELTMITAFQVIADVLAAYELEDDDAIDAIRALRAAVHGFVSIEAAEGFRLSADIDRSFDRLIRGFAVALPSWSGAPDPSRERL